MRALKCLSTAVLCAVSVAASAQTQDPWGASEAPKKRYQITVLHGGDYTKPYGQAKSWQSALEAGYRGCNPRSVQMPWATEATAVKIEDRKTGSAQRIACERISRN